jgi:hypothetical protein
MILASSLFGWWLVRGTLRPIEIDEAARASALAPRSASPDRAAATSSTGLPPSTR